jgi:hypothetical protein
MVLRYTAETRWITIKVELVVSTAVLTQNEGRRRVRSTTGRQARNIRHRESRALCYKIIYIFLRTYLYYFWNYRFEIVQYSSTYVPVHVYSGPPQSGIPVPSQPVSQTAIINQQTPMKTSSILLSRATT